MRSDHCAVLLLVLSGCTPSPPPARTGSARPRAKPPELYRVRFQTTQGDFLVEVTRAWAPRGADHFYELVNQKFYDGARFFRVVRRFIAQFGIHADPKTQRFWGTLAIPDDSVVGKNRRGTLSFAKLGPQTRTTQVFINLSDNPLLDRTGFAPFGRVVEGMETVDKLYFAYGEVAPRGAGPDPTRIQREGNFYLDRQFPRLDSIVRATVVVK